MQTKMLALLKTIQILVICQIFTTIHCEDGFDEQNLRLQQFSSNDEKISGLSYNNNLFQRDANFQTNLPTDSPYQQNEQTNNNNDFSPRSSYTRSRKVYRIKNPFQNQPEESERQQENTGSHDSNTGASNQYASMQYSLPPDDFLQQFRTENQYYQQTQISTPAPIVGYTATPVPQQQYQYSTIQYSTVSQPSYESSNQQSNNQIPLEPKSSYGPTYLSSLSPYQYSTPNTFSDNTQSTPRPEYSYLSTPFNNGQYSSQSNTYVSSASPVYVSSPSNQQAFLSSPLSTIQDGSQNYSNRVASAVNNNQVNYDNNDYSAGRYQNMQQQYQNDYSTTTTPNPLMYSEHVRDMWQNNIYSANNGASMPFQYNAYNQYQHNQHQNKQGDMRSDTYTENSDTNRIGSIASANNMFIHYVQPDGQALNSPKLRTRDTNHETGQADLYSNGDFGWKLTGKKPLADAYSSTNYNRYSPSNTGFSDNTAISQMNFHMGTVKPYSQFSKSTSDTIDQEFAQAAAKAHERFKQQQQLQQPQQQPQHQYSNINTYGTSNLGSGDVNYAGISYYNGDNKQKNKLSDLNANYYTYGYSQNDLITASPLYLSTSQDNVDNQPKLPFDHDKALKNIVPIDVSNVVGSSEPKTGITFENSNRFNSANYVKDQTNQNVRQYIRPVTDSYYKDKNAIYGFNIKTKSNDYSSADNFKQAELSVNGKSLQSQEPNYNQGYAGLQSFSYSAKPSNNYHDNLQSSSLQQPGLHRNHNLLPTDIASILKLNDVPYKLTQGLSSDALKFHNINFDQNGLPSSLPMRINQNVGSHHLDATTNLLNKLLLNKPSTINSHKPEIDSQTGGMMSTINGFKVANPFNVDLKLVAELLKGKPAPPDTALKNQYPNSLPLNSDLNSQLQLLLKNENNGNLAPVSDGLSALGSSFVDVYSRYPYQKYSRSQEEEESLVPIAAASNTYPIGAVMEQDDPVGEREVNTVGDFTAQDDILQDNFEESRPKTRFVSGSRIAGERHRHPNLLLSGKHAYQKKHIKSDVSEPHPLLKPPPPHHTSRGSHIKMESKNNHRRRIHKPKLLRVIKTEPLFEAGSDPENLDNSVSILLRPPALAAEARSDIVDTEMTA